MPTRIFSSEYTTRRERMVVSVPAPAIKGNARGTIELDPFASGSSLISVIPNIISIATIKMTIAPATAKDATSSPNKFRMDCPKNKKLTMRSAEMTVAFSACILPSLLRILITTGIDPRISITENRMSVTEKISFKLIITSKLIKMPDLYFLSCVETNKMSNGHRTFY